MAHLGIFNHLYTYEAFMSFVLYSGYTREMALLSVGEGWAHLIHRVFDVFDKINLENTKIVQVKEKYAGLRIYTSYSTKELDAVIREVERESYKTCETCGQPGKTRGHGWLYAACDAHTDPQDLTNDAGESDE